MVTWGQQRTPGTFTATSGNTSCILSSGEPCTPALLSGQRRALGWEGPLSWANTTFQPTTV